LHWQKQILFAKVEKKCAISFGKRNFITTFAEQKKRKNEKFASHTSSPFYQSITRQVCMFIAKTYIRTRRYFGEFFFFDTEILLKQ